MSGNDVTARYSLSSRRSAFRALRRVYGLCLPSLQACQFRACSRSVLGSSWRRLMYVLLVNQSHFQIIELRVPQLLAQTGKRMLEFVLQVFWITTAI
jgi:hypothetical protein